ncbi:WxL protein peptidoglycan domain-containing protein [Paractinoplanes toevensis]|uniref:WxL Interacting Protein peptidoglycan binding domain-containing protein n=1 Tax=Paractinoplanes toevensis TaxID=571911 RepID=A0A919W2C4_9ACTN|nr:DUF916 domain-containing protein [Actinoplanes toevensis]GIM91459.1 hypothetical protein Ato02nite_032520 [Actinoplanes toevensis]
MRKIVAALLATLVSALFAAPAHAEGGDVTWTVRTAANSYGDDRTSYSYAINPGGTIKDAMVVANRGKAPLNLAVYTADGYTTDSGQLDLRNRDVKAVAVGTWARPAGATITVPPGKTVEVPFTVTLPDNATPGDYVGGIVTSLTQPSSTETINVERRLGIRIKLRVGGDLKPALSIENLSVDWHGSVNPFAKGDAAVSYTIHNTGNATLSATQALRVEGPFGMFRTDAAKIAAPPELLPGESWKVSVPVHAVAAAFDLVATATVTPVATDASGSTSALPAIHADTHFRAVSWTLLLLIALIVAAALIVRRNRARRSAREDDRVQKAVADALREKADTTA